MGPDFLTSAERDQALEEAQEQGERQRQEHERAYAKLEGDLGQVAREAMHLLPPHP